MSDVAVVITCYNRGRTLLEAIESVLSQTRAPLEVVVVDDGSTDLFTQQVLNTLDRSGVQSIRIPHRGASAARNVGIQATKAPLVVNLDGDDTFDARYIEATSEALDADKDLAFVSCAVSDIADPDVIWTPSVNTVAELRTHGGLHIATLMRREVWAHAGGFDERLRYLEDADFWIRVATLGYRGVVLPQPLVRGRSRHGPRTARAVKQETHVATTAVILGKHRSALEPQWRDLLLAKERFLASQREHRNHLEARRTELQALLRDRREQVRVVRSQLGRRGLAPIDMSELRRPTPLSDVWGLDRGKPIDRHYIENFLARYRHDIRGRVLEVKDSGYTTWFGTAVERSDVIDIDETNLDATLTADLTQTTQLPAEAYDCFICTQTLNVLFDVRAALQSAYRTLKPGGVLLCTVSALNRVSAEGAGRDGDYWRFTEASIRTLLAETFPLDRFEVESFGNVFACSMFLYGASVDELDTQELETVDPYFPVIIAARAVKPAAIPEHCGEQAPAMWPARTRDQGILMYHRVDDHDDDAHGVSIPLNRFLEQVQTIGEYAEIVPLSEFIDHPSQRHGRPRVALTFDDGSLDHCRVSQILSERGLPATYFVTTAGLNRPHEYYWDTLAWLLSPQRPSAPELVVTFRGTRLTWATSTAAERMVARTAVNELLAPMTAQERTRIIASVAKWSGIEPTIRGSRRTLNAVEILTISRLPGQTIGSHSTSHLVLPAQPLEVQVREVVEAHLTLEQLTGVPIRAFCYPYGLWNRSIREVVRSSGYDVAVGVEDRTVRSDDSVLSLPRIDVRDETGASLLQRLRTSRS